MSGHPEASRDEIERRLRDSEERFRLAWDSSVVGLAILAPDGRTLQVNPAAADILGYDQPTLLTIPWTDLIDPTEVDDSSANFARVMRGEVGSTRAVRRYRRSDGTIVHLAMTASPMRDTAGTITGLFVQAENITEQHRLDLVRQETEERLELVLDATRDGIWDWNLAMGRAYFGPQWFGMLGYPAEGRWGDESLFRELMHPDDASHVWAANERQINDPDAGAYDERFRMRRADGSWAWIRSRGRVIQRDATGRALRMVGTHTDVTAEVEAAEARRRSEERYALVIAALEDGVWDHDLVTNTGLISPRYLTMLGYPARGEITYDELLALIHPDDRVGVIAIHTRQVDDPAAGAYDMEFRMRRADGTYARIRCRGRVVERDTTGRATRAIGTHTDVTERRIMEEQFRHTQKMEAIGKLAGGVAHDFNNLLTTISATTEVLREELDADDPHRVDLDQIVLATERAKALTGKLLAFSRLEVERRQQLALDHAVRQVEPLLRRLLAPGQELVVALDANEALVSLDPAQLELALLNLVANARDAMPGGGTVTVRTQRPNPHEVLLTVTDTGLGMEPGIAERAFEPFFTTKPQGKGTGLGLATVYGFAERLGGGVTLQTAPGAGTTLTLTIPVARDAEVTTAPVTAPTSLPPHSGRRVLVVDDEAGVRRSARRLLERRGYTVFEAEGSAHALALLQETTVDVLLTDHAMPGGTGRDLITQVIERHPLMRVVLMSGFAGEGDVRDEIRGRVVPFLPKPFTLDELVTIIDATD